MNGPRRRSLVRSLLAFVVVGSLLAAAVTALGHDPVSMGPGTVTERANETTIVSVQGFHFKGNGDKKKPARLVGAGPRGDVEWRYDSGPDARWFYDVDPLPDGNVFVTSTVPGDTIVFEYDPANRTRVWSQRFDATDTHDADLLDDDRVLLANMRMYDASSGVSDDRVYVYDRSAGAITWEWRLREYYDTEDVGDYEPDWSHLNDVDEVRDGTYLLSPRNFDQAIVVDRETETVTMQLGENGDLDTMAKQHNPDMFVDDRGRPTILVADSENDRVLEFTYEGGENASEVLSTPVAENEGHWNRTWSVDGFKWPRDADRLPNGNTLVTDTLHQRVVEITPEGEVVWEFYAPWAPYDAERVGTGDGSSGPTIAAQNATGNYTVHGGAGKGPLSQRTPAEFVIDATDGWPFEGTIHWIGGRYYHIAPFVRPVWLSEWAFAYLTVALLVGVPWGAGELYLRRRRVRRGLGRAWTTAVERFRAAD